MFYFSLTQNAIRKVMLYLHTHIYRHRNIIYIYILLTAAYANKTCIRQWFKQYKDGVFCKKLTYFGAVFEAYNISTH